MFNNDVCTQLQYYVYRLIDPRTGETFYVGKGKDNRVFQHAKAEIGDKKDEDVSDKLQRIREIKVAGFEVAHVIHRHGLTEKEALEVEAALIDAYSGMTNIAGGHYSDDRGVMHVKTVIEKYEAAVAELSRHKLLVINVNLSVSERASVYESVRYSWKVSRVKAERADYVLAVQQGMIIGVFQPEQWLAATPQNFPGLANERPGRHGFIGVEAPDHIKSLYLRKRLPDDFRPKGAANPIRYTYET